MSRSELKRRIVALADAGRTDAARNLAAEHGYGLIETIVTVAGRERVTLTPFKLIGDDE